jgi:hypothetical protein
LAPQVPRVRFVSPPGEADTESVTDVDSEEEVTAMEASSKGLGMGKLPRNWEMDRKWYIGMCVSLCILRGNYRCILAWLVCIYISYIRIRVYNIYIYTYYCTVMITTTFGRFECRDISGRLDGFRTENLQEAPSFDC